MPNELTSSLDGWAAHIQLSESGVTYSTPKAEKKSQPTHTLDMCWGRARLWRVDYSDKKMDGLKRKI